MNASNPKENLTVPSLVSIQKAPSFVRVTMDT